MKKGDEGVQKEGKEDKGDEVKDPKEDLKEKSNQGIISRFGSGVAWLAILPFKTSFNVVSFAANITGFIPFVGKIAALGSLEEGTTSKWIDNNKDGIGSVVFAAVVGAGSYYALKAYKEWEKNKDEDEGGFDYRSFFNEDEKPATEEVVRP